MKLSEDDGPTAHEFLEDDYDEDNTHLNDSDDEPLSEHVRKATQAWREPNVLEEGQQIRVPDATIDVVRFLYGFLSDDDVEAHERLVIGRYGLSCDNNRL